MPQRVELARMLRVPMQEELQQVPLEDMRGALVLAPRGPLVLTMLVVPRVQVGLPNLPQGLRKTSC
jgi:hypothetical protein